MEKKEAMKSIKCEKCGHVTSKPIHWEAILQGYRYSLASGEYTGDVEDSYPLDVDGGRNEWACPRCGAAYPARIQEALNELTQ